MNRFRRFLVLAISAVALGFAGTAQAEIVLSEVAGLWLMDEGTGSTASDSSAEENDGSLEGGASFASDSPFAYSGNYCLSLDGSDDKVDCGTDSSLQFGDGDFSVHAWVKSNTAGSDDTIMSTRYTGASRGFSLYTTAGGAPDLYMNGSEGTRHFFGSEDLVDGTWHQIAVTFDASADKAYIYVDGELDTSLSAGFDIGSITNIDDQPFTIGAHCNRTGYNFPGLIDEVMLIDRMLTLNEINSAYNNSLITLIPEPSAILLLVIGLGTFALVGRRRTKRND